jgi:DNA-binding transcriptional MerR regulator
MQIGELARRVGRSVDTIKRWEDDGLISCDRDERGRRLFKEAHVDRCRELAYLGVIAQLRSARLADLASAQPMQLSLLVDSTTAVPPQ